MMTVCQTRLDYACCLILTGLGYVLEAGGYCSYIIASDLFIGSQDGIYEK